MTRAADLLFEESVHIYRLKDGRVVPSVTQILGAVGVAADFEAIGAMRSGLADQIEERRNLGAAVHQDAHAYDDDDLDRHTVDARVEPYLQAWITFRANHGVRPLARERVVFDPVHFYCGTLDGVFLTPEGRTVLIDIKIGDPKDAAADLQTSAYEAAWRLEHHDEPIHERWAVQLLPGRSVPYNITPYTDWRDFAKFKACVTVFHEQAARRRGHERRPVAV